MLDSSIINRNQNFKIKGIFPAENNKLIHKSIKHKCIKIKFYKSR